MFRLYLKAGGEVVCSDIVFSSTTMRRVGNYIYDKSLITGTEYIGCVAENRTTDATNTECLDYIAVLNNEISQNVTSTNPFTVNSQYQAHIADKIEDHLVEEHGKFLKIVPNTTDSEYVTKDQCNTANSVLIPDLITEDKRIHNCIFTDSNHAGKEFFTTDAATIFQLEQSDVAGSHVLAEEAPFLRVFGRAKAEGGSIIDKIFYKNEMHLPHGFGADDEAQSNSTQIQVNLNLASGNQETFTNYSEAATVETINNHYIIQNLTASGLGETYVLKNSTSIPTECDDLYVASESGKPHKCIELWSILTKFAGPLPINSAFKVEDPGSPKELTVEDAETHEVVEKNTKIKFTGADACEAAIAATNAGLVLRYGSTGIGDKYGCIDDTKIIINIVKNGHVLEVCGDETEITSDTKDNIITNYINRILPGITTAMSVDDILAKSMVLISNKTGTLSVTKTFYFEENGDFSSLPIDFKYYRETSLANTANGTEKYPQAVRDEAIAGIGAYYIDSDYCYDHQLAVTGEANFYSVVCLRVLTDTERAQFNITHTSINNPDETTFIKVNETGCAKLNGYIDFTIDSGVAIKTCKFMPTLEIQRAQKAIELLGTLEPDRPQESLPILPIIRDLQPSEAQGGLNALEDFYERQLDESEDVMMIQQFQQDAADQLAQQQQQADQILEAIEAQVAPENFEMGYLFGPGYCTTNLASTRAVYVVERVTGETDLVYVCRKMVSEIELPVMLLELLNANNTAIDKYIAITQDECLAMGDHLFIKVRDYWVCRKRSKCLNEGGKLVPVKDQAEKIVAYNCLEQTGGNEVSCTTGTFDRVRFPAPPASDTTTPRTVSQNVSDTPVNLLMLDDSKYCIESCPDDFIHISRVDGTTEIDPSELVVEDCYQVTRATNASLSDLMTVTKTGDLKLNIFQTEINFESTDPTHKTHVVIDQAPGTIKKIHLVTATDCDQITDFVVKSVASQGGNDRSDTAITGKTVNYCISKIQCMNLSTDDGNNYIDPASKTCFSSISNLCYKQADEDNPIVNLKGGLKEKVDNSVGSTACHDATLTDVNPCGATHSRFSNDDTLNYHITNTTNKLFFCMKNGECKKIPGYIEYNGHCTLLADTLCPTIVKNDLEQLECVGSLTGTNYAIRVVDLKIVNYTFKACALEQRWIAREEDSIGECVSGFATAMNVSNMKYCIMSQGQCNSDIAHLDLVRYRGSFMKHETNDVFIGYPPIRNSKKLDPKFFKYTHTTNQRFYATIPEIIELNNGLTDKLFIDFQTLTVSKTALGACTDEPFFASTIPAGNILSYGGEIDFCIDRDRCYNSGGANNDYGDWSLFYYNDIENNNPQCGISCAAIDALIDAPTGDTTLLLMDGITDQNQTCIKTSECTDKGFFVKMGISGTSYVESECNMECPNSDNKVLNEVYLPDSPHTMFKSFFATDVTVVSNNRRCFPDSLSTIYTDNNYRVVEKDTDCTDDERAISKTNTCMLPAAGDAACLTDLSKPLCPDVFFVKSTRQKIDEADCDEQPTGTTGNTDPKMPSYEDEKNICYLLNDCTVDQYIYIDYTGTIEGKGITQLKCGDFCIRRHVFVNSAAIPGLTTQKFCVDDCHDLERLKDLHITDLQVEDFETQFNTIKMIGECETFSCPSESMLTSTNEEYKYCSVNLTTDNKICGHFLGNIINLDGEPGEETCVERDACRCTADNCAHVYNPNLNTCTTKQGCFNASKRLSLADNGELFCIETPQATPPTTGVKDHNLFINGSRFNCNRFGDGTSIPYVWVQPDSDDLEEDVECITRDKCIKDKRFLTLDGRCVTELQCIGTEPDRGQLGLKLLFGEADSQYCVTDYQCTTFSRNDSTSLVPRPARYLFEDSHPTCFNCLENEFYIPSIYFTKPAGTCAERCVENPNPSACEANCSIAGYVPSFNCVASCPSGFWQRNSEKVCQPFCSNFLDETQQICQDSCRSRHVKKATTDHYICLSDRSCGTLLKMDLTVTYKSSSVCVNECPIFYRQTTTNMCISCSTLFYNDQCNPVIPEGLIETKDTTIAESCSTCTTLKKCFEIDMRKKYYYKGRCYSSTGLNLADKVLLNDEFNTVVDCGYKDQTGIDPQTQTCVTKCPSENQGFFNRMCKTCIKEGENFGCYIENGVFKASANCPVGMARNPDKPFFCITQTEAAQKQAAECKGLTVFDIKKKECVPCNETGTQVIVNEQCVNDCGIKKKKVLKANNPSGKNICQDCPAYSDSNNCIEKCSGEQIINTEGKCEPCPAQNEQGNQLKFVNGECKKICSATDASNCIAETDAQEGATCTGCIDCNGQTATLANGMYKCVCLGELKGKNCRTSPQTAEAIVAKNAEDLTQTIFLDAPLTSAVKTQAQTMIETVFENSTITISAENSDIVERGLNIIAEKLEALGSTVDTTNFTTSEEELNSSAALADTIINGINNYNKVNEIAKKLSSLNGNRILQSSTVQLSLIFQSVLAKAKTAIRTWVNAYANKPTLNIALATLNFSSFKAHFFPLSKDRETKISAIKRLEQLNIPVVEVDACVDSVMSQEGVYPIIAVVIFNQNITNLNNSKSYETFVFSSQTRKQVDCSAFTNSIQIESDSIPKLSRIKSKILEVKKSNKVDLLDRNSGFYEDRCQKYSLNGFIFTPKMKRNILYPKLKVECSEGCKFVGMTDSYKALCQCFNQNKTVLKTEDDEMDASSSTADYPGEIVKCNLWLDSVNDWYRNYALYLLAGITFFTIVLFTIKVIQDEVSQINSRKYKIFKENNEFLPIGAVNEGQTKLKVEERDNSRYSDKGSNCQMMSRVEPKSEHGESRMMDGKSENSISIKKSVELTACQLDNHSPFEVLEHDNRSFVAYLLYVLSTKNVVLAPFLAYSLIKPFFVRVYDLMVYLLLVPFFVTVLTWDEHIESIYFNKGKSAFGQTFSQFKFGWDRVAYGILATFIVRLVLHKIVTPSDKMLLQLSLGFAGAGETVIREYNQYKRNIAVRLGFYFFFATSLSLVAIYYCLAYIDFYTELNSNWLIAVSVAIGAGIIFQVLLQLLHVCVWAIARRVNFMKYAFALSRFLAI